MDISDKFEISSFLESLKKTLSAATNDTELFEAIVNAPFYDGITAALLYMGLLQMTLVNPETQMVDRIALSDTEPAHGAVKASVLPFKAIHIPAESEANYIVKAIKTGHPQSTSDWQYLFIPALSPEEAQFNQAGAGAACSFVYPFHNVADGGALTFSFYKPLEEIENQTKDFMKAYTRMASEFLSNPPRQLL
jgi:hypothetical protein